MLTILPDNSTNTNLEVIEEIFAWAKKNDVSVLDYFDNFEDSKLDLNTDFRDNTHLNYSGAIKATEYFKEYLKNNYQLQDHRGDKRYALWENNDFDYDAISDKMKEG